jgi:hypothetical protein
LRQWMTAWLKKTLVWLGCCAEPGRTQNSGCLLWLPKMVMLDELNIILRLQVAFQGVINQWTSCGSGMCHELNVAKTEATLILGYTGI